MSGHISIYVVFLALLSGCGDADGETSATGATGTNVTTVTAGTATSGEANTTGEATSEAPTGEAPTGAATTGESTTGEATTGTSEGETIGESTGSAACSVDALDEPSLLDVGYLLDLNFAPDKRYIVFQELLDDARVVSRMDVCGGGYEVLLSFPGAFEAIPRIVGDALHVALDDESPDAGIWRYTIDAQGKLLDAGTAIVQDSGISSFDVSADGKYAFYWYGGTPNVHDLTTDQVLPVEGLGIQSYFSPDSARLLTYNGPQLDIYTMGLGTFETHPVGGEDLIQAAAWMPDGQRALLSIATNLSSDTLGIYDLGSKSFTPIIEDTRDLAMEAVAVDQSGTRIAFVDGPDVTILDLP